jgi:Zn-dependent alcohol dehydrogenase
LKLSTKLSAIAAGELDVESFISHRITLSRDNDAFELTEARDGIRSVIVFG